VTRYHLDHPQPIYHIFGSNPCGEVVCLKVAEVDPGGHTSRHDLRHLDGSPILATDELICDSCGAAAGLANFQQLVRGYPIPPVDTFRAAMRMAIARSAPRATTPRAECRVRLRHNGA